MSPHASAAPEASRADGERDGLTLLASEREKFAAMAALTRTIMDILQGAAPARASDAAVAAHAAFDASLRGNPPARAPDCRKGCGHCCRVYVSATAPEVFALARAIRALPADARQAIEARLDAALAASAGRDWSREPFFTHPCPLLEDGACTLHPLRPDACRGVSSFSVEACLASLAAMAEARDVAIPRVPEHAVLRALHGHVLWAALRAAGLPEANYGLVEALRRVLDVPDAEARWLEGEDVFAGVGEDATVADLPQALVEATISALIAGATGELRG